jgi:23S rRNA pseudouridine2605 synthase
MLERLQKILANAGVTSRREAETFITLGRVTVNGVVVTELGTKADPDKDLITCDGKPVQTGGGKIYLLLYKPAGYMTTLKDPEGRPVVTDLLKDVGERVYPVGRLDYNTEGLLLLTNDGDLANRLMHPRHEVDKGYLVRVRGQVAPVQLRHLADGVLLDDGMTAPAQASIVKESENNSWISLTIHEGRFRQVRRMCETVGLTVVRLKRSRYGFLEIGTLKPGEYRLLTPAEVEQLRIDPSKPPRKTPSAYPDSRQGTAPGKSPREASRPNGSSTGEKRSGRAAGEPSGKPRSKASIPARGAVGRFEAEKAVAKQRENQSGPIGKSRSRAAAAPVRGAGPRADSAKTATTQRETPSGVIIRRTAPSRKPKTR